MKATLCIKKLHVETVIGIHPWEQMEKQSLYLNLNAEVDITNASQSDNITDALDYQKLSEEIMKLIRQKHFQLIESMARCIVEYLQTNHAIVHGHLELIKPRALARAEAVSIILDW